MGGLLNYADSRRHSQSTTPSRPCALSISGPGDQHIGGHDSRQQLPDVAWRLELEDHPVAAAVRLRSRMANPARAQALAEADVRGDPQQGDISNHPSALSFVQIMMPASRYRLSMADLQLTGDVTVPHCKTYNNHSLRGLGFRSASDGSATYYDQSSGRLNYRCRYHQIASITRSGGTNREQTHFQCPHRGQIRCPFA